MARKLLIVSGNEFGFECKNYNSAESLKRILNEYFCLWENKYGASDSDTSLFCVLILSSKRIQRFEPTKQ